MFRKKEKPKGPEVQGSYNIAPHEIPAIRIAAALGNKSDKDLCFVVGGGLGDRVCAEPTLRFALNHFRDVNISLICETPQLFDHLHFNEVFDLKNKHPVVGRHLYLHTYPTSPLLNQFLNPNMCHSVDIASMSSLRIQLPFREKRLHLEPTLEIHHLDEHLTPRHVLVHLGKSWPSRTFPEEWWNKLITLLMSRNFVPVLVGKNCIPADGTGCVDLRDKLSLDEYIYACVNCKYIVTNDSSPLHLASAGHGKIAFISTCRRGDLITHYRQGGFGWKMMDFQRGNMWIKYHLIPNTLELLTMRDIPAGNMNDFLPEPLEMVEWLRMK